LTPASQIAVRPVRWMWEDRLPLGALALMGGREGIGKSMLAYQVAADVTNGCLLGQYAGQPKSVIIAAAEDSWDRTIVPRLMAAGADLDRVFRVDVVLSGGAGEVELSLPDDLPALEDQILLVDAALVLLDPLLSRLNAELDSHKDAEVRSALEPIVRIADNTDICVLGLIHVNKGSSTDPLTMLMGSRAFVAVARAVLFVMVDPEDEEARIVGQAKNNLGRLDIPSLTFTIEDAHVCDTPEGPVHTGRLQWTGETDRSIAETVEVAADAGGPSVTEEAEDWLVAYLNSQVDGSADSATVKEEARKVGHSTRTIGRARRRLKIVITTERTFPKRTIWALPAGGRVSAQPIPERRVVPASGGAGSTGTTGTTKGTGGEGRHMNDTPDQAGLSVVPVGPVGPVRSAPKMRGTTTN
jgi:hypothetical protein